MRDILLSVIVPVYNTEKYLSRCIESILAQSFSELEIILVDDGSADNSGKICDIYAEKYERVQCIHKKNGGACYARRDGVRMARGEYVGFVDSDDWIDTEMYKFLMQEAVCNQAEIVTSGFIFSDGGELIDVIPEGIYCGEKLTTIYEKMIYDPYLLRGSMLCSVCTKIYKKELLENFLEKVPPNLRVWEDLSYVYLPCLNASCIQITHRTFYHYMQHADSTSHKFDSDLTEKTMYAFRTAQEMYCQCADLVTVQLRQLCLHCLVILLETELDNIQNIFSLKREIEHIKSKWENQYFVCLYADMRDDNIYIPPNEMRICDFVVSGKMFLALAEVKGEQAWSRLKKQIRHIVRPIGKLRRIWNREKN